MSFSWGNNHQDIDIYPYGDTAWHDLEINLVTHPQGAMISISLGNNSILEDEVLVGYQPGQQTRFIAGARDSLTDGAFDIDSDSATSLFHCSIR